ncbi:hypothetical protein LJB90_02010 [Eubacteriales bacterium OttesenSCG-928-G02]|nr:hypothetical protein [Eubacteriales bacterium OttesenSCG-928-G02]
MAGIHDDHRKRLKARYINNGIDSFEEYLTLELLLGYAIPRRDTNPLAHSLINKYGSIKNLLSQDIETLKSDNLTEHTVILLKLIWDLTNICAREDISKKHKFNNIEEIANFMKNYFLNYEIEAVYALALSRNDSYIDCKLMHKGNVSSASFKMRTITEFALKTKAHSIVIAHNHPNESPYPSTEDIISTKNMKASLLSNSVVLKEHLIIYKNGYTSIMDSIIT